MSTFHLAGDQRVFLTHMGLFGLTAILAEAGIEDLTVHWDGPRACIDAPALDPGLVDDVVRAHASSHTDEESWVTRDEAFDGNERALMSPRQTGFKSNDTWRDVHARRKEALDVLTRDNSWLDLRLLAALGEPCYWSRTSKGELVQDDAASRFEMQPRNRGAEIVTNRLRPLAASVAARPPGRVAAGLDGTAPVDELGKGAPNSVTATGFSVPGPVDNALAWCALWGVSALPLAHRVNGRSVTSGHVGRFRREFAYAPVWRGPWRPARVRTILASAQLRTSACAGVGYLSQGASRELSAGLWLRARGAIGIMRFSIENFGTEKAAARRALYGEPVVLAGGP